MGVMPSHPMVLSVQCELVSTWQSSAHDQLRAAMQRCAPEERASVGERAAVLLRGFRPGQNFVVTS